MSKYSVILVNQVDYQPVVGLLQLPTFSITQPSDKHKHVTDLPSSPRNTPSLTVSPCNVAPLSAITTKQNYNSITYMYTLYNI